MGLFIKRNCKSVCECDKKVIASFTVSPENRVWDLTPYQGAGIGSPNAKWRIVEVDYQLEYERGDIDANGQLTALPSQFTQSDGYDYEGHMELQQGCPNRCRDEEHDWGDEIEWP